MKKLFLSVVAILVVLLVAVLVVVYFSLNTIVKRGVETVGPTITKVEVKLGAVNLSPFSGRGELSGLVVGNPEGFKSASALSVQEVRVALKPKSVFSEPIVVDEISVKAPEITF